MNKRFRIVLQYKGQLPKTMNTLFRSEKRARETLQLLRTVCTSIALCEFHQEKSEYVLKEVYEYQGFVSK